MSSIIVMKTTYGTNAAKDIKSHMCLSINLQHNPETQFTTSVSDFVIGLLNNLFKNAVQDSRTACLSLRATFNSEQSRMMCRVKLARRGKLRIYELGP